MDEECDHTVSSGLGEHLSWCAKCLGDVRYRDDTGEYGEVRAALDRLGVRIVPDHVQRSEEDQWRLVAGDMALLLTQEQLDQVRLAHEERVGTVPDFTPSYEDDQRADWFLDVHAYSGIDFFQEGGDK